MADREAEPDHWFETMADHLGAAYLRYSFTRGTDQEVDFLVDALGLEPGMSVLDVGCGPGRHAHALARRGLRVHGIDISERFVALARADAPPGATFERLDARRLEALLEGPSAHAPFDVAVSLCQGAFGLAGMPGGPVPTTDPDGEILRAIAAVLRPGGRAAISAFSAYFQVQWLDEPDADGEASQGFDADHGVNHERTAVLSESGEELMHDLWTSCFTPRELRLLAGAAGLDVEALWSVTPGRYARRTPSISEPEYLLIARKGDDG